MLLGQRVCVYAQSTKQNRVEENVGAMPSGPRWNITQLRERGDLRRLPHSRTALSGVTLRGLSPEDQDCAASYVKSEKPELTEAEEGGGGWGPGPGRGGSRGTRPAVGEFWGSHVRHGDHRDRDCIANLKSAEGHLPYSPARPER